MPETPPNDIERLLKATAEKRRQEAGGPFELHPATRRMLLDEAARTYASKPGPSDDRRSVFANPLKLHAILRFAFTTALVTGVLGFFFLALTPTANKKTKQDFASLKETADSPTPSPVAAQSPSSPMPVPEPTAPAPAASSVASATGRKDIPVVTALPAAAPVAEDAKQSLPEAAKAKPPAKAESGAVAINNQPLKTVLPATAVALDKSRAAAQVATMQPLASFELVQSGSSLRLIDSDGSSYTGTIHLADSAPVQTDAFRNNFAASSRSIGGLRESSGEKQDSLRSETQRYGIVSKQTSAKADQNTAQFDTAVQSYNFRVSGSNQTINQSITLTGQLLVPVGAQMNQANTRNQATRRFQNVVNNNDQRGMFVNRAGQALNQNVQQQNTSASDQSRITGEMRVGDRQPVPLEAEPLGP